MWPLAKYTLLESLRDRIYLGFLVALVVLTALLVLIGATPFGLTNQIVERLGWMSVDVLLSVLTAIYTVHNVVRERDRKILYSHLTLPLSRSGYIVGKALGFFLSYLALAICGCLIIIVGDWYLASVMGMPWYMGWLVPSVLLKALVLIGYAILLTQLSSGTLTATLFTLGVYLIGNGADDFLSMAAILPKEMQMIVQGVYYLIPNLQLLDFEHAALYAGGVSSTAFWVAIMYAASYATATLAIACLIFKRKDL